MIPPPAARDDIKDPIAAGTLLRVREPQTTTSAQPANTSPFFPDPSTFHIPQSSQSNPSKEAGGLAKSVLEYLFLSVALLIVGCTIFRRLMRLRRSHKPLRTFFRPDSDPSSIPHARVRSYPRTTGLPPVNNDGRPYPPYPDPFLSGFPPVYLGHTGRRTTAGDIDANGRRLVDRAVELDHDGTLGDKDTLPAYDFYGGPPKYVEVELQSRVIGNELPRSSPTVISASSGNGTNVAPSPPDDTRSPSRPGAEENGQAFPGSLSGSGHPSATPENGARGVTNGGRSD